VAKNFQPDGQKSTHQPAGSCATGSENWTNYSRAEFCKAGTGFIFLFDWGRYNHLDRLAQEVWSQEPQESREKATQLVSSDCALDFSIAREVTPKKN